MVPSSRNGSNVRHERDGEGLGSEGSEGEGAFCTFVKFQLLDLQALACVSDASRLLFYT